MQVVDQSRGAEERRHQNHQIPILRSRRAQGLGVANFQVIRTQASRFKLLDLCRDQRREIAVALFDRLGDLAQSRDIQQAQRPAALR